MYFAEQNLTQILQRFIQQETVVDKARSMDHPLDRSKSFFDLTNHFDYILAARNIASKITPLPAQDVQCLNPRLPFGPQFGAPHPNNTCLIGTYQMLSENRAQSA